MDKLGANAIDPTSVWLVDSIGFFSILGEFPINIADMMGLMSYLDGSDWDTLDGIVWSLEDFQCDENMRCFIFKMIESATWISIRVAHSDFCVAIQKYICAVIDVERACVKGETLILNIDKVSDVSAMIEHTLSFVIHISCNFHNLGRNAFVSYFMNATRWVA